MQVNEIHPQLSNEEREKRIGYITDEMLKIAADVQKKKAAD